MAACYFRWVICRRRNVQSKLRIIPVSQFIHELTRYAFLKRNANLSDKTSKMVVRGPNIQFWKWRTYAYSRLAPDLCVSVCTDATWLTWGGAKWTMGIWILNLRRSHVRKMGRIFFSQSLHICPFPQLAPQSHTFLNDETILLPMSPQMYVRKLRGPLWETVMQPKITAVSPWNKWAWATNF